MKRSVLGALWRRTSTRTCSEDGNLSSPMPICPAGRLRNDAAGECHVGQAPKVRRFTQESLTEGREDRKGGFSLRTLRPSVQSERTGGNLAPFRRSHAASFFVALNPLCRGGACQPAGGCRSPSADGIPVSAARETRSGCNTAPEGVVSSLSGHLHLPGALSFAGTFGASVR